MTSHTFTTEIQLPILEAVDQNTAKKIKEMCKDMEGILVDTNQKISVLLQNQSNSFFKAFKIVVEQMSVDFKNLQQKFEEYIAYHENETEVVNAQNKLAFFRNECSVLNRLCIDLKSENNELKQKIKELEQEVNNHKIILLKQIGKNSKLYDQIQFQKSKFDSAVQGGKDKMESSIKFRVPQLKLQQRHINTEVTQDYDQPSVSTYSHKHQILSKDKFLNKHAVTLNKTSDDIIQTATRKQQFGIKCSNQINFTRNHMIQEPDHNNKHQKNLNKQRVKQSLQITLTSKTQKISSNKTQLFLPDLYQFNMKESFSNYTKKIKQKFKEQWVKYVVILILLFVAMARNAANVKKSDEEPMKLTEEQLAKTHQYKIETLIYYASITVVCVGVYYALNKYNNSIDQKQEKKQQ